jgi:hypothetical protein
VRDQVSHPYNSSNHPAHTNSITIKFSRKLLHHNVSVLSLAVSSFRTYSEHAFRKVNFSLMTEYNTSVLIPVLRFQVLTAASMKMTAFWDIAPCSLVKVDQCFRGSYCLHHQGDKCSLSQKSVVFLPVVCSVVWGNLIGVSARWHYFTLFLQFLERCCHSYSVYFVHFYRKFIS